MNDLISFMDSGAAGDQYVYARGNLALLRYYHSKGHPLSPVQRREVLEARDAWAAHEAGQVLLVQRRGPDGVLDYVAILSRGWVAQRDFKRAAKAWP